MLQNYYPGAYAPDVFSINYQWLFDQGYRGILFDVDNTLVHHNADSTPEVDALFRHIHAIGLKTVLVSNNSPARLERFMKNIDSCYVADADKPNPQGYEKALQLLEISKEQAVFIGDQMFIDIFGANRCGIASILVHFVVVNKSAWIGLRRYLEKIVLCFYRLRPSFHTLKGAIKKE